MARANGLPRCETLQPEYNPYDRAKFEGALRDLCARQGLGVIMYYGLASGFLSGKCRSEADLAQSPRGARVKNYLNERGMRILAALGAVTGRLSANPAEVALAWLMQREKVIAPIAGATSLGQLASLLRAAALRLPADDVRALDDASA